MALHKARPLAEISIHAAQAARKAARDGAWNCDLPTSLEEVSAGVAICRRCELWRGGGGVSGSGPTDAPLMLVGERPVEADAGPRVFGGPAKRVLDAAMARAGLAASQSFVTAALRHTGPSAARGGLAAKPSSAEISACRWWLEAERRLVRPKVVVAFGQTAASAVFGRAISKDQRGCPAPLPDRGLGLATVGPDKLLRLADERVKRAAFAALVADLALARRLAG